MKLVGAINTGITFFGTQQNQLSSRFSGRLFVAKSCYFPFSHSFIEVTVNFLGHMY